MKAARCPSAARMDGKTVIITGANTGIGKETARELARRGARVIMACRDTGKGERAAIDIMQTVSDAHVIVKLLDLASLRSIRAFAEDIKQSIDKLHVLINNAGVGGLKKAFTEDGFEVTFGVNHLGHFLLTNLLTELLIDSAPSRVVTVAAHAHLFTKLDMDDLMMEKDYGAIKAYCRSKLANILFTRELNKRLEDTAVSTFCLHPGIIRTEFLRHLWVMRVPGLAWVLDTLSKMFLKTAKEGCQTTVLCSVSRKIVVNSGMYFSNCAVSTPSMHALNEEDAVTLWEKSERLVGIHHTLRDDHSAS